MSIWPIAIPKINHMIDFGVQAARSLTLLGGGPQSLSLANHIIVSLIMGLAIIIVVPYYFKNKTLFNDVFSFFIHMSLI